MSPLAAFVTDPVINQLNAILRAELGAAESCDRARDLAPPAHVAALTANRDCHRGRARLIGGMVQERGGEPSVGWGVWSEIAAWTGASRRPSADDFLSLLQEGERRHLHVCQRALAKVDPAAAEVLRMRVLPAQEAVLERLRPVPVVLTTVVDPEIELVRRSR